MAESTLSILLQLRDEATTQLNKFNQTVQDNKKLMQDAGKIMVGFGGAVTATLGLAVKAGAEEQVNIARLSSLLKNVGVDYDNVKTSLEGVIRATQNKTGIADSEQRDTLGRLILVTNDYNKALSLLPLTLDLAAAGGMDAATAATYLGKAYNDLKNGAEQVSVRFGQASMQFKSMAEIEDRVRGSAEAMANPLEILKASFGDLAETIGSKLLPVIQAITDKIIPVIESVMNWIDSHKTLSTVILTVVGVLGLLSLAIGSILLLLPHLISGITALVSLFPILTGATIAQTAATGGLTTAMGLLNLSFLGPAGIVLAIGAAVAGFGLLINKIINSGNAAEKARDQFAGLYESLDKTAYASDKVTMKLDMSNQALGLLALQEMTAKNSIDQTTESIVQQDDATKKLYDDAWALIKAWDYERSAANEMGVTMQDIYFYLLDIGTETQRVGELYAKFGTDTINLNALLNETGITLDQVGWKYGNLADKAKEAEIAMVTQAQAAADAINTLVGEMNRSLGINTGGGGGDLARRLSYYPKDVIQGYKDLFGADWERMLTTYGTGTGEVITAEQAKKARDWFHEHGGYAPGGIPWDILAGMPSYESGGVVPGPVGQPVPVLAHGGEKFLGAGTKSGGGDIYNFTFNGWVGTDQDVANKVRKEILYVKNRNFNAGLS